MSHVTHYSLDELCSLVALPRRTVRYYMQIGLLDKPEGETRAARYFQKHLDQLQTIKKWAQAGLSLERIREHLEAERQPSLLPATRIKPGTVSVKSHLLVDEGVELVIEPHAAGLTPEQVRALAKAVTAALQDIQRGGKKT